MPRRSGCGTVGQMFPEILSAAVTRASRALDEGALRQIEAYIRRTPAPRGERAHARERLLELARVYSDGTLGHDSRFFAEPAPVEIASRALGEGPEGSRISELSFASEYRPFHAEHAGEHLRWRENLTAHARLYHGAGAGRGKRRPVAILVHGWGGGNFWFEERAFAVARWLKAGFDVALFQLPFHGRRAPAVPGAARSGSLFPSPHLVRTNEAFGQAIWDLRVLARHLRDGDRAVGVMGMSLGGYTTALWASLDPRLAFAAVMIPLASLAEMMWRHGEHTPAMREAIKTGVTLDLMAEVFAVHTPTTRPVQLPADRLFVIAGKADCICPPDQARRIARHWGTDLHWFPGGHVAQVGRGDAFRTVLTRLSALDLVNNRS
jgi:pimeloyl-ACP methyl ester carboxylesterase